MLSKSYRLIFYILAGLATPFLFLGVIEGVLRLTGYGYPTSFFTPTEKDGKKVLINNPLFGRRFFPESLLREAEPFVFSRQKAYGCRRIFVLGSSAAQGDPDPAFGFSRILDIMLQHSYPKQRFEIINMAVTAINSHVVLPISRDCGKADPDLLILLLGNNEVVGPFGAGTIFTPVFSNINLLRARVMIQSTRIGQLFTEIQSRMRGTATIPDTWGGMEMFLGNRVGSDSPALEKVYANFRQNLADICRETVRLGIDVIVCTVPVNVEDSPPFASLHAEGLSSAELALWDSLYQKGVAFERAGQYDSAVSYYTLAVGRDSLFADVHFRMARCLWELGKYDRSKTCFEQAREQDALCFRAKEKINAAIRALGSNPESPVYITDVAQRLEKFSPYKTPGREFFYDHVHLNFAGNYHTASSIFLTIEDLLRQKHGIEKSDTLPSMEQCEKDLALTTWDKYQIGSAMVGRLSKPPFSNQLYHADYFDLVTREKNRLRETLTPASLDSSVELYRSVLQKNPDDWRLRFKLGNLLQEKRDYVEALHHYRIIVNQVPQMSRVYGSMGVALSLMGLHDQAIAHYRAALGINPRDVIAMNSLGVELVKSGRTDTAAKCFQQALQLNPLYVSAHLNYANLLSEQKKFDDANSHFDHALSLDSNHTTTLMNYGYSLLRQKRIPEAQQHFKNALTLDSNLVVAHIALGNLLSRQYDFKSARFHYRRVLGIDSNNTAARNNLTAIDRMLDKKDSNY